MTISINSMKKSAEAVRAALNQYVDENFGRSIFCENNNNRQV